jgi:hypothetical protein
MKEKLYKIIITTLTFFKLNKCCYAKDIKINWLKDNEYELICAECGEKLQCF